MSTPCWCIVNMWLTFQTLVLGLVMVGSCIWINNWFYMKHLLIWNWEKLQLFCIIIKWTRKSNRQHYNLLSVHRLLIHHCLICSQIWGPERECEKLIKSSFWEVLFLVFLCFAFNCHDCLAAEIICRRKFCRAKWRAKSGKNTILINSMLLSQISARVQEGK